MKKRADKKKKKNHRKLFVELTRVKMELLVCHYFHGIQPSFAFIKTNGEY